MMTVQRLATGPGAEGHEVTPRPSVARNLAVAASWPLGVAFTGWHYLWRTTALHRREGRGRGDEDGPPGLADGVSAEGLQQADDGVGPLFHRRYRVRAVGAQCSAEDLIGRIAADPNCVAPTEFARFTKTNGHSDEMGIGDEYLVRMPGPWNGPVRVVTRTPTSFRLATLDGHLEAGQIEFRASGDGDDLVVEIESWARSGDRLSQLLYQHLHMAKEVQLHMWTSVLERCAVESGGRLRGGIDIDTRRVDEAGTPGDGLRLGDATAKRMLQDLHDKPLNFDLDGADDHSPSGDWLEDEYRQSLPGEAPGDPEPGGSWEVARRLMGDYEFADPAIVRAVYRPDHPLEDRDMLLEARFWGMRFRFGVRVGGVRDETRSIDGREVRVWGWNYRTLQGHLEKGQMDYEVWKWHDSGEVEFVTCRFSRRSGAGNPIVRLGLRLFGRRQQVRFAKRACERMLRLTTAELAGPPSTSGVPRVGDEVEVR